MIELNNATPAVADIDIAVSVIQFLRAQGVDVVAGREENWNRYEDRDILREAHAMNRSRQVCLSLQRSDMSIESDAANRRAPEERNVYSIIKQLATWVRNNKKYAPTS